MPSQTTSGNEERKADSIIGMKQIMIVAGEASGDFHAANLIRAMRQLEPRIRFYGMGGRRMQEAGADLIADAGQMAVVGLTDVLLRLRLIRKVMNDMTSMMKKTKPDLLILIDYPGFNLRLAQSAQKLGIKVFYYIGPKVWAWGKGRIRIIRKWVDKMAVIFPFEEEMYRDAGVDAVFVGHPLLDTVKRKYRKPEACAKFGLQENATTVALLPGSRTAEVTRLLPEMLDAARIIAGRMPSVQFVLPLADTIPVEMINNIIRQYPVGVTVVVDDTYDAVAVSDFAMVASGTATLETALLGIPMIIVYKVSALTYHIGKKFVRIKDIGLPNIVAEKTVVPELLQDDCRADKMAAEAMGIMTHERRRNDMVKAYACIRKKLGGSGAAERAACMAIEMIAHGRQA